MTPKDTMSTDTPTTFKKCNICDPLNEELRAHFDTQKEVYECTCQSEMKDTTPTLSPEAEARFDEKFCFKDLEFDDHGNDVYVQRIHTNRDTTQELKAHIALEKELSRREGEIAEHHRMLKIVSLCVQGNVLEIDALNTEKGIGNYPKDMTQAMGVKLLMEVLQAARYLPKKLKYLSTPPEALKTEEKQR